MAATRQPVPLPSDIRIIVRKRRSAALGRTVHDQSTLVVALRADGRI